MHDGRDIHDAMREQLSREPPSPHFRGITEVGKRANEPHDYITILRVNVKMSLHFINVELYTYRPGNVHLRITRQAQSHKLSAPGDFGKRDQKYPSSGKYVMDACVLFMADHQEH